MAEHAGTVTRPRRRRSSWGHRLGRLALHVVAVIVLFVLVFPILWAISTALKSTPEALALPPRLIPETFNWGNFADVFRAVNMDRYLVNSAIVATCVTVVALFFHTLSAYSLARLRYRGRNVIFVAIISTLMVPFTVIVVPLFVLVQKFGWVDSYPGLIVPLIPDAFGIFLLRQFYLSLPREIEQAAMVDGASLIGVYWRIVLPLSKPILAALAIFFFVANWNNFLWPLVVTQSEDHFVTQVGIQQFTGSRGSAYNYIAAGATIAAMPMIVLFFLLQRRLIEGVKLSGLKG